MTRYANIKRDEKICFLVFDKGLAPKEVFRKMELANVFIVYRVLKKAYGNAPVAPPTCKCPLKNPEGVAKCRKCMNALNRASRLRRPMTAEERFKSNCRSYTHVYVKRGVISRQPCTVCGEQAEAHHEDYSKPLDVVWMCRKHHLEHHKRKKTQI